MLTFTTGTPPEPGFTCVRGDIKKVHATGYRVNLSVIKDNATITVTLRTRYAGALADSIRNAVAHPGDTTPLSWNVRKIEITPAT